jgi:predicted transcriptional regulator
MSMLKDDLKQIIDNLPDDCSLEDIQYTLYVRKKIQQGQDDLNEGRIVTHEEMEKRMSKWLNQ